MRVLVVGGGGREHALTWKLAQSSSVTALYAAPGNPGIAEVAELVPIQISEEDKLVKFATEKAIDLVLIGPEGPLVSGLADKLRAENIHVFGPGAVGAQLEGSKSFAKDFMARHQIPTAAYQSFTELELAHDYLMAQPDSPIVLKADGIAQGKGVIVAENRTEALAGLHQLMTEKQFGDAGSEVVIEEFMSGEEVSLLVFSDGKTFVPMLPIQDHKRIGEGDTGLNTGGMGAYGPALVLTPELQVRVEKEILEPVLKALQTEDMNYRGCLYVGLMLTPTGPKVVEFNARFGDPETQVLMTLLDSDFAQILLACATGSLKGEQVKWKSGSAACVVLASKGYPESFETGKIITGLDQQHQLDQPQNFHAGTKVNENGQVVTAGGRVLTVTFGAESLPAALSNIYDDIEDIHFDGCYCRKDIGYRELARLK